MALFGLDSGAFSILIYRMLSNQEKIARVTTEGRAIRRRLIYTEPHEMKSLVFRNTKLSFHLFTRALGPSLAGAVPVIVVAAWLAVTHGYTAGDGKVTLHPPLANAELIVGAERHAFPADGMISVPDAHGPVELRIDGRVIYSGNPHEPSAPAVSSRPWWAFLLTSEAGFLVPGSGLESISFGVEPNRIISGVPGALAG